MLYFEQQFPGWTGGVNFNKSISVNGITTNGNGNVDLSGSTGTFKFPTGVVTLPTNQNVNASIGVHTPVAINATATATAAQVASGYITSTSAAAVTLTLPTATLLGTKLGAVSGTTFDLWVDNTAGANTVTVALGSGMTASDVAAVATYGVPTFGLLTVSATSAGIGRFTFAFSSATACTVTRTA